jgi:hypothetical protein
MKVTAEIEDFAARWVAQPVEPLELKEQARLYAWVAEFTEHRREAAGFFDELAITLGIENDGVWPLRLAQAAQGVEIQWGPTMLTNPELIDRNTKLEADVALWRGRAKLAVDLVAKFQPQALWSLWWVEPELDGVTSWAPVTAWLRANGWQEADGPHVWLGAPATGWKRQSDPRAFVVIPAMIGKLALWRVICELSGHSKRTPWDTLTEMLDASSSTEITI